ncbi:MAG: hypothetical protein ABI605_17940 [Rhizobacter sp.]
MFLANLNVFVPCLLLLSMVIAVPVTFASNLMMLYFWGAWQPTLGVLRGAIVLLAALPLIYRWRKAGLSRESHEFKSEFTYRTGHTLIAVATFVSFVVSGAQHWLSRATPAIDGAGSSAAAVSMLVLLLWGVGLIMVLRLRRPMKLPNPERGSNEAPIRKSKWAPAPPPPPGAGHRVFKGALIGGLIGFIGTYWMVPDCSINTDRIICLATQLFLGFIALMMGIDYSQPVSLLSEPWSSLLVGRYSLTALFCIGVCINAALAGALVAYLSRPQAGAESPSLS